MSTKLASPLIGSLVTLQRRPGETGRGEDKHTSSRPPSPHRASNEGPLAPYPWPSGALGRSPSVSSPAPARTGSGRTFQNSPVPVERASSPGKAPTDPELASCAQRQNALAGSVKQTRASFSGVCSAYVHYRTSRCRTTAPAPFAIESQTVPTRSPNAPF